MLLNIYEHRRATVLFLVCLWFLSLFLHRNRVCSEAKTTKHQEGTMRCFKQKLFSHDRHPRDQPNLKSDKCMYVIITIITIPSKYIGHYLVGSC